MASDRADQPTARHQPLLADYLLADHEGPLFLIGTRPADIYWPESSLESREVHELVTLSEALQCLSGLNETAKETSCAVLNIQDFESDLEPLMGRAVRAFPHRLIVYTLVNQTSDALFYSFGFKKLNVLQGAESAQHYQWYEFRLSHYKPQPDWLNSRFWANPERFDLDEDEDVYGDEEE